MRKPYCSRKWLTVVWTGLWLITFGAAMAAGPAASPQSDDKEIDIETHTVAPPDSFDCYFEKLRRCIYVPDAQSSCEKEFTQVHDAYKVFREKGEAPPHADCDPRGGAASDEDISGSVIETEGRRPRNWDDDNAELPLQPEPGSQFQNQQILQDSIQSP
ncbi:MAG: hypothetical protein AB7P76_04435 [Candidatus Melainabacteria bacterium]